MTWGVAGENRRVLHDDFSVDGAGAETAPYLKEKWQGLADHPLVGEAPISGLMGSIALTPHKESRAKFASEAGTAGLICREHCFANRLVMRHVGDRMVISPPLVITHQEIDALVERAWTALDLTHAQLKNEGLLKAAS